MVHKIAFLFLTVGDINFPDIWKYYFKNNNDKINIYVHPKYPEKISDDFFKYKVITDLKDTSWCHITNAIKQLILYALLDDDSNKYFIILSESCLPIKSFNLFYKFLFSNTNNINVSYIDLVKNNKLFSETITDKHIQTNMNYMKFTKHSGWFCISKVHAIQLISHEYYSGLNKYHCADELMFSLLLPNDNIIDHQITYVNWDNLYEAEKITNTIKNLWIENDKNPNINIINKIKQLKETRNGLGKHPKEFDILAKTDIIELTNTKAFFARKFSKTSTINKIYRDFLT